MFIQEIIKYIPSHYKKRGVGVAFSVLIQALLNFVGLAVFVPVLMLLLDSQGTDQLRNFFGIIDESAFVVVVCSGVFFIVIVKNVAVALLGSFQIRYVNSLYCYYSEKLYNGYFQQGLSFIKESNSTSLSYKINSICYTFAQGVISRLYSIAGDAVLFLLICSALLVYAPLLALILMLSFVPAGLLYYYIVKRNLERYGKTGSEFRRKQMRLVSETFTGYVEVCINNAFSLFSSRFKKNLEEISYYRERTDRVLRVPNGIIECAVVGAMILMVFLIRKDASMTFNLGLFAIAALRLLPAVRNIVAGLAQLKNNSYTIEPVKEVYQFEACRQKENIDEVKNFHFNDKVVVDNISYAFTDKGEADTVIEDFSMTLHKGEKLGITGASGIGKTTLFNMLLGFYSPRKGSITIDGVPLDNTNMSLWHDLISYVPQDVFLMDGTIAENVAFGFDESEIDHEKLMDTLTRVSLFDFVSSLEKGIDTQIGENGCRLSEGQRQRIGIARALYKKAKVLFLDEATSSLDFRTESDVIDTIRELSNRDKELTIVMITHRVSTLDFCDRVIKMVK